MELNVEEMKKSGSRFQVARVNTRDEHVTWESDSLRGEAADDVDDNQDKQAGDYRKQSVDFANADPGFANSNTFSGGRGSISNGPESPGATFSISGDSLRSRGSIDVYNKTHCVMNTVEALPCVDHYRNIFSATSGGIKLRPTLAELHEELVRTVCVYIFLESFN